VSGNLLLASYPKSGNTWMRAFLSNLRQDTAEPADINDLDGVGAAGLMVFEEAVGVEASDLTDDEIDRCRPFVYRYLARNGSVPLYLKTHDSCRLLPEGQPLIPPETVSGVVYIMRNPLDVAVSFAHHMNRTIDHTIGKVMSVPYAFKTNIADGLIWERLLSWSDHVLSWVNQTSIPMHIVRYEDMEREPVETFTSVARFCGLPCDPGRIERALRHSSFESLKAQEREKGFRERSYVAESFFRSGKSGAWRGVLSEAQIEQIVHDHGIVMRRFGYL